MEFVQFPQATLIIGAPRNSKDGDVGGLPAAIGTHTVPSGDKYPCIVSCFKPTEQELEDLNKGGSIYLHVLAHQMVPVMISTTIEADLPAPN